MISPYKGKFHVEWYPKTASTAFANNDLVYLSSGYLTNFADAVDQPPLGLIQKTVTATDSDYASTTMVPVLIGDPNAEYLCDISTGTGAQSYVGTWIDVDDDDSVDVSASTYDIFFVTKHISTTQCVAKMQSQDPYQ
jgi:hypothetical protein